MPGNMHMIALHSGDKVHPSERESFDMILYYMVSRKITFHREFFLVTPGIAGMGK